MDRQPSKTLDSPRQSRRRGATPSISEPHHPSQPAPVSGSTSTPLPSIRVLHPDLPPPNRPQFFGPPDSSVYPHSFDHLPPSGHGRYGSQPAHQDPTKALETIEESDSDKHSSPPPKKRRKRQALSCTECKRRKIKCDRTQPCGPCARRGEQDKCQWHQVETNDKWVTRGEYDLLKSRVDHLEDVIARLTGRIHMQSTMVPAPTMPPGAGSPNPPYAHHARTAGPYGLATDYGSDPYLVNTRPPVTALPSSSRTTISGEINPPATEREISSGRQYQAPRRSASRQFQSTLGHVAVAPSYGSTEGTDERPKKPFAWTQQGVRPRQSSRAVDLGRQAQLYSILLPSLFLLVSLIRLLILHTLPLVPLQSFRWKPLQRTLTIVPPHREGYGIVGRIATQSLRCLCPRNAPEMAGPNCHPPPLPVTNDPCQIPDNQSSYFRRLGSIMDLGVLGWMVDTGYDHRLRFALRSPLALTSLIF